MSQKSVLRIHTQHIPDENTSPVSKEKRVCNHRFFPGNKRPDRSCAVRRRIVRTKPGHAERLMRNSAIACSVLLGVLTLTNIDQPWAKKAADGIEQALTMRIDLDDTIGELTFVKELMPESALVFLNISGEDRLMKPVEGVIEHPWSELQPWLMFSCKQGSQVIAADDGTVTAISALSDGRLGILIDHGNGLESVYAYMENTSVSSGDTVSRGQSLGVAGEYMYFEWRVNGKASDPTEALGL